MSCETFRVECLETPTGRMLLVSDDERRVRALDWEDHADRMHALLARQYGRGRVTLRDALHPTPASRALNAYFAGSLEAIDALPTKTGGTPFQQAVWAELRRIPIGQTVSYAALAQRLGRPDAIRAVGLANGANPIAIIVPCHRVIGANGSLTGYGGGLARKAWLLAHEGARLARPAADVQTDRFNEAAAS